MQDYTRGSYYLRVQGITIYLFNSFYSLLNLYQAVLYFIQYHYHVQILLCFILHKEITWNILNTLRSSLRLILLVRRIWFTGKRDNEPAIYVLFGPSANTNCNTLYWTDHVLYFRKLILRIIYFHIFSHDLAFFSGSVCFTKIKTQGPT